MKIFICCSKAFYGRVADVKTRLEAAGHKVTLPNSYDNPTKELEMKKIGIREYNVWKVKKLEEQVEKIKANQAILVLNFEKDGQANYIGGATFLEIYMAFNLKRKVFLYNPIPQGILKDEISAFEPIILNGDLSLVA